MLGKQGKVSFRIPKKPEPNTGNRTVSGHRHLRYSQIGIAAFKQIVCLERTQYIALCTLSNKLVNVSPSNLLDMFNFKLIICYAVILQVIFLSWDSIFSPGRVVAVL